MKTVIASASRRIPLATAAVVFLGATGSAALAAHGLGYLHGGLTAAGLVRIAVALVGLALVLLAARSGSRFGPAIQIISSVKDDLPLR